MALLHQIFAKYLVKERGEPFYLKNTDGIQIGIRFILGIVFYILWSQALYDKIFLWNQLAGREGHLLFYSSSLCQILLTILMEKRGLEELKKKPSLKKNLCCLSVLFMISCLLEVTLFQYRHYESFGNEAVSLPFEGGRGLVNIEGNIWEVVGEEDVYLEVSQLDLDVKNIHIDFLFPKLGETAVKKLPFHFNIRDEGSSAYYELPERVFYHHILQSQYIRLHPYGKCLGVRIYPQLELGEQIEVIKWSFNSQVPAMLSLKRTLFLFMVFSLLFLIRPSSELYQYLYIDKFPFRKLLIVGFALVQIFLFSRIVRWNQFFLDPKEPHHQQYYMLTEALLQGELFLLKPPPEGLIELENPYDYKERLELSQRTGEEIYWDVGGADHHHRNPLDLRQHLLPGQAGQHQVQQYQVGPLPLQQQHRLRPGVGPDYGISLPLEQLLQNVADVDVVVDDRDGFHGGPPDGFSLLYPIFRKDTRAFPCGGRTFVV